MLASNNNKLIDATKSWFSYDLDMKMGDGAYMLGAKILRDQPSWIIGLPQQMYIRKVFEHFNMSKVD